MGKIRGERKGSRHTLQTLKRIIANFSNVLRDYQISRVILIGRFIAKSVVSYFSYSVGFTVEGIIRLPVPPDDCGP